MVTVTSEEIKDYLGVNDLPANIEQLKLISETMINNAVFNNYSGTLDENKAMVYAICAQIAYMKDEGLGDNGIRSYTNDDISITYTDDKGNKGSICETARIFLNSKRLLYRGGL